MDIFYSQLDGVTLFRGVRDRETIRNLINHEYKVFPKTKYSENSEDAFTGIAGASYFADDTIMEIEFYAPECKFFYQTYNLLGMNYGELLKAVELNGWDIIKDDETIGLSLESGQLKLYIPDMADEGFNAKCKAVCVVVPPLDNA